MTGYIVGVEILTAVTVKSAALWVAVLYCSDSLTFLRTISAPSLGSEEQQTCRSKRLAVSKLHHVTTQETILHP
jgi:hypothetical protein